VADRLRMPSLTTGRQLACWGLCLAACASFVFCMLMAWNLADMAKKNTQERGRIRRVMESFVGLIKDPNLVKSVYGEQEQLERQRREQSLAVGTTLIWTALLSFGICMLGVRAIQKQGTTGFVQRVAAVGYEKGAGKSAGRSA